MSPLIPGLPEAGLCPLRPGLPEAGLCPLIPGLRGTGLHLLSGWGSGQSSVPPPLGLPEGGAVFPLKSGLPEPIFTHLHKIRTFYVLFGIAHKITMYFIRMKGAMCPFKTSSGVRRILYFSCLSHWMLNTDIYFEFFRLIREKQRLQQIKEIGDCAHICHFVILLLKYSQ